MIKGIVLTVVYYTSCREPDNLSRKNVLIIPGVNPPVSHQDESLKGIDLMTLLLFVEQQQKMSGTTHIKTDENTHDIVITFFRGELAGRLLYHLYATLDMQFGNEVGPTRKE